MNVMILWVTMDCDAWWLVIFFIRFYHKLHYCPPLYSVQILYMIILVSNRIFKREEAQVHIGTRHQIGSIWQFLEGPFSFFVYF